MLSVIVPTKSKFDVIKKLILSMSDQSFDHEFEVLIIRNPKDDKFTEEVNEYSQDFKFSVKVYSSFLANVNVARNLGLTNAKYEIVLFLDDDCEFENQSFFTRVLQLHLENLNIAGFGGYYRKGKKSSLSDDFYIENSSHWLNRNIYSFPYTKVLLGGNLSIKKSMIKDIRFDEKIAYGGSELSFCYQCVQRGLLLKVDKGHDIVHVPKISIFQICRKAFLQGKHHIQYMKRIEEELPSNINSYYDLEIDGTFLKRAYGRLYNLFFQIGRVYFVTGEKKNRESFSKVHFLKSLFLELKFRTLYQIRRSDCKESFSKAINRT